MKVLHNSYQYPLSFINDKILYGEINAIELDLVIKNNQIFVSHNKMPFEFMMEKFRDYFYYCRARIICIEIKENSDELIIDLIREIARHNDNFQFVLLKPKIKWFWQKKREYFTQEILKECRGLGNVVYEENSTMAKYYRESVDYLDQRKRIYKIFGWLF